MSLFPIGSLVQADTVSGETTGTNANYYNNETGRPNTIFSNYDGSVKGNTSQDIYYTFYANSYYAAAVGTRIRSVTRQNYLSQLLTNHSGNALVAKVYDASTGSYKYKVMGTSSSINVISELSTYLNNTIWYTESVQKELYSLLKSGDTAGVQALMAKYLPKFYVVTLSSDELSKINDMTTDEALVYLEDSSSLNGIGDSSQISVLMSMSGGGSETVSGSSSYTYTDADVQAGVVWRPMDRTLTIKTTYLGGTATAGTVSLEKYWVTESSGTVLSTDSTDPVLKKSDTGTASVTYTSSGSTSAITGAVPYAITAITVDNLTTGKDSIIDLSYANTSTGNLSSYTGTYTDENGDIQTVTLRSARRYLIADSATLAEGTTFRLGAYGTSDYQGNAGTDTVYIGTATPADTTASTTNLYIQLGYVPGISTGASYGAGYVSAPGSDSGGIYVLGQLLGIYSGAEKFTVTAQTSKADGIYSVYEITPIIGEYDNYFLTDKSLKIYTQNSDGSYYVSSTTSIKVGPKGETLPADQSQLTEAERTYLDSKFVGITGYTNTSGTMWYLKGYTYEDTGEIAESGKTAGDNALTLQNLWKAHVSSLFNRPEDLHRRYTVSDGKTPRLDRDLDEKENVWAEAWHGRYGSISDYGRHVSQNYTGLQAGYDKLLNGTYGGGKVYAGLFAARLDSDSDTSTGKGDQDGSGMGFYGTWVGSKGHYVDAVVSALRLSDDYHFIGNTGDGTLGNVYGKWSTWTYGMGLQYGKRNDRDNGFWWDPHVSVYMGHMNHQNYTLSNGLGVENKDYDILTGRIGVTAGKTFEKNKGRIYAGVSLAHEFGDGQDVDQYWNAVDTSTGTTQNISDISKRERAAETGGHDTWVELKAGGDVRLSDNSKFHGEYTRSVGRKDGNDWGISGRLEFAWAGLGGHNEHVKKERHGAAEKESMPSYAKAHAPTVVLGQAPEEAAPSLTDIRTDAVVSKKAGSGRIRRQTAQAGTASAGSVPVTASMVPGVPASAESYDSIAPEAADRQTTVYEGTPEGYQLKGVTVEADRPDWEKELSPGQVSVIYPKDFEGEQKDLPALLDRIPGLFIDRMNGQGHYTTARIRGSSAAQVDVYVDGVRMNLSGDTAVNLSAIPVDNVERIEVYRGYVPARFAGSPLGGVINIITKKPVAGHGYVTQGFRSYGGYTSNYEYSMPLGTGSLMATWGRDIWQGDFRYWHYTRAMYANQATTMHRRSNDYQNNNGMVKWQDQHWMIKAEYKNNHEGLAHSLAGSQTYLPIFYRLGFNDQHQNLTYKELYIGRQDTWKNLDVNWHVAYADSNKRYYNDGAYKMINAPVWPPEGYDKDQFGITQPTASQYYPGMLWGHYHSKKWDYNLNMAYHLWNSHLIEFNSNIVRETMDTDGNGWDWTQDQVDRVTGLVKTWRKMIPKYHNNEYHFTLQDTMTLNDAGDLKLTAIGRADKVDMSGMWEDIGGKDKRWMYSGGAALQKQLDHQWSMKTTWGTYYRHPNFYEIFGDGGTILQSYFMQMSDRLGFKNGTWESGTQFDFSLNRQGKMLGSDSDTVVTWFQRKSDNQLVLYTPWRGPGVSYYMPSGHLNVHGIELSQHMKWDRFNLALAGTWQRGRSHNFFGGLVSSTTIGNSSFVPEWVLSARLDYTFPGDRLNLFGEYKFNGREVLWGNNSDTTETSNSDLTQYFRQSYAIVNVGAKYKFNHGIKLTVGVDDLFNEGFKVRMIDNTAAKDVSYPYPLPGRIYYATMEYSF